jgi:nicotinamidase-related amidase
VVAAIAAGLAEIDYLCIATPLTLERKRAIQLSHNAIAGQDDPVTLATMYADLDLDARNYSGLDDSVLKAMENVELAGLNVGIKYQDMHLYFLPEDAAVVGEVLKDLDAAARKNQAWVARYADFDAFFETAVATKLKHQAFNTGVAVGLMAQLARERLAQLEAEAAPLPNPEDADAAG